jgi:hypothetical protein
LNSLPSDARNPDQPRRLDAFVVSGNQSPVKPLPGNRALVAREA